MADLQFHSFTCKSQEQYKGYDGIGLLVSGVEMDV